MKNKRGDLLKNVLALIIAVVGIGLIIFAAVKLYRLNVEQDSENAKKLLSTIEGKIKNLKDGEIGRFPIRGIKDWYFVGWHKDEKGRPDKCFFESCVCVCKEEGRNVNEFCQGNNGFCKTFEFNDLRVLEFNRVKDAENYFSEEKVIKEFKLEYNDARKWSSENNFYNLVGECPFFSESNLVEILIYKKDKSLNILKVREIDFSIWEARRVCNKNG